MNSHRTGERLRAGWICPECEGKKWRPAQRRSCSSSVGQLNSASSTMRNASGSGARVVEMASGKDKECSIVINGLHGDYRAFVDETFRLNRQQSRGAWFLPTEASLRPGTINFPANFQRSARFASNLSWEEHCKASLEKTADALLVWALLEPLFDA